MYISIKGLKMTISEKLQEFADIVDYYSITHIYSRYLSIEHFNIHEISFFKVDGEEIFLQYKNNESAAAAVDIETVSITKHKFSTVLLIKHFDGALTLFQKAEK